MPIGFGPIRFIPDSNIIGTAAFVEAYRVGLEVMIVNQAKRNVGRARNALDTVVYIQKTGVPLSVKSAVLAIGKEAQVSAEVTWTAGGTVRMNSFLNRAVFCIAQIGTSLPRNGFLHKRQDKHERQKHEKSTLARHKVGAFEQSL
jgi:hypothetical protein